MDRDEKLDRKLDQLMAKLPSAEELLTGWSTHGAGTPCSVHGTAVFTFERFNDPRLVLVLGIGRAGAMRVAWCLWGAANNQPDPDIGVAAEIPAALSDPARRVLPLLAVDQRETEEAASAELAEIEVAREVAQLAMAVRGRTAEDDFRAADFRATVHAVLPGTDDVDVICLGTPIRIRAQ